MKQKSKSRNADFISIAAERQSATLGAKGPVKLKNPWARKGPSILRTFFRNPSTQPADVVGPNLRRQQPSPPFEPFEPSELGPQSGPFHI